MTWPARASVTEAQAAVFTDSINQSKASIGAPTDGVVLTRNVDPGNAVAASLQAVTLFSVAEDLAQLRLQVYVDEADVGKVSVGQAASFTVSAHPGRRYPASITRVAFGSTITENVVTYLTHLDVDNADLRLRPGMTATATIVATSATTCCWCPTARCVFHRAPRPTPRRPHRAPASWAHESDMAAYARRVVRFVDGRIASDVPNPHPAPPAATTAPVQVA